MAEQIRLDTSTRIAVRDVTDIEWFAADDDGSRHAFPRRDGFPPPAACGVRWTVRHGRHGSSWCDGCLAALKDQIRAATAALAVAEREDLAAGDFYAGMDR